ncbi:unnamed protein product [Polarella glacialis]|uniref:Uncharacterized protein n=1 Tax=Polarella glacialis TaxID=89957 RepID=A0A813DPF4_POLGL|nr:unnamed protein product [Polarella glacialis]
MGSGASSSTPARPTPGPTSPGSSLEQWLMTVIDKEKREKEWMAEKYDKKCAEAALLQQELQALRAQSSGVASLPSAARALLRSPSETEAEAARAMSPGGTPSKGMQQAVQQKTLGDVCDHQPGFGGRIDSPKSQLNQRRGLHLSVSTSRAADAIVEKAVAVIVVPTKEHTVGEIHRRNSVPATEAQRPAFEKRASSVELQEPMSALLRRRKEDWLRSLPGVAVEPDENIPTPSLSMRKARADGAALTLQAVPEDPTASWGIQGPGDAAAPLKLEPNKVFSMFEDCPASPKRVRSASSFA